MQRYENLSRSAGNKKFISAAVAADYGDSQALWIPPQVPFPLSIAVGSLMLLNRSGGAVQCGLAGRLPRNLWVFGTLTAAGVFTDDTADAQDVDAGDVILHSGADSGSGFLLGCQVPFNIFALIQTAQGDQGTPVKVVEYWNGTAWTQIPDSALLITDALIGGTGAEKVVCFPHPSDWVPGGTGTGVPAALYNLRVRHTNGAAGTENPTAAQFFLGYAKVQIEALADNSPASLIREREFLFPAQCDALFPAFSVAARGNTVEVDVRVY